MPSDPQALGVDFLEEPVDELADQGEIDTGQEGIGQMALELIPTILIKHRSMLSAHTLPGETVDTVMTQARLKDQVADAIRALDPSTVRDLSDLATEEPEARLVAVEVENSSIDISDGRFLGRVNLLVSVPFIGFNGKLASTRASLALPSYVSGAVSDTGVVVQEISVRHQAG